MQKKSTAILQFVTLTSPDGRYDSLYLANYATITVKTSLAPAWRRQRAGLRRGQYSMRIWLDPHKLYRAHARDDVSNASSSRASRSRPARSARRRRRGPGRSSTRSTCHGRLDAEQFDNIVVKTEQGTAAIMRLATSAASSSAPRPMARPSS